MTKIKVESHLKRYVDVETADKLALIEGLTKLVKQDRQKQIEQMKAHLAQLENGEFPIVPPPPARPKAQATQEQTDNDIVEEPDIQTETTQEEALDNL